MPNTLSGSLDNIWLDAHRLEEINVRYRRDYAGKPIASSLYFPPSLVREPTLLHTYGQTPRPTILTLTSSPFLRKKFVETLRVKKPFSVSIFRYSRFCMVVIDKVEACP